MYTTFGFAFHSNVSAPSPRPPAPASGTCFHPAPSVSRELVNNRAYIEVHDEEGHAEYEEDVVERDYGLWSRRGASPGPTASMLWYM